MEQVNKSIPEIRPGMVVRVHEKLKEKNSKGEIEERTQVFEGTVIACHAKKEQGATFTVRKESVDDVGVEKIYPLFSPSIAKIEVVTQYKVRRAKLNYLRDYNKKMKTAKA